jgi:hypothetical protein
MCARLGDVGQLDRPRVVTPQPERAVAAEHRLRLALTLVRVSSGYAPGLRLFSVGSLPARSDDRFDVG